MKNAINWFAIPVADLKRAVKFYNSIFDFKLEETQMGDMDLAFFPIENGGIGGHLFTAKSHKPSADGPILYLNGGDDLQVVLDRVEGAGGKILGKKSQISPEVGYTGFFEDSEGNKLSLHSPK